MPKKPTQQQKNQAKLPDLLKQKVSTGSKGFLKADLKKFIAEEMIHSANNQKRSIKKTETLQKRYNKFKPYYDKLFTSGLTGHSLFTGTIEKNFKKDTENGTEYYINENGKEKKVTYAELAYKMELLAHNLSTKHDVAFTKFKPTYFLLGKGKYKVVVNIPSTKNVDFEEMTVQEVLDYFEENNTEIIISDPHKLKTKEAREKFEKGKKERQKSIKRNKEKHYRQWKKPAKKKK